MQYLYGVELITLLPVPLSNPKRIRKLVNPEHSPDVMLLTKEKTIDQHIIYEGIRAILIKASPVESGEVSANPPSLTPIHHEGEAPFHRMMMRLQLFRTPADEAPLISQDELLACFLKKRLVYSRVMGRYIDFGVDGEFLNVLVHTIPYAEISLPTGPLGQCPSLQATLLQAMPR